MKPKKVVKDGRTLWCNTKMDRLREDESLCGHCSIESHCFTITDINTICLAQLTSVMVTACACFRPKPRIRR